MKKSKQQVVTLNKDLIRKDEEMKNMAKKMNASLRETFDTDRVKYEEEISNLKTKLQGWLGTLKCHTHTHTLSLSLFQNQLMNIKH